MQNANIKYKIRLDKPPHEGTEIEFEFSLDEIESDSLPELFIDEYYPERSWPSNYYTVIERTIELFEE